MYILMSEAKKQLFNDYHKVTSETISVHKGSNLFQFIL